MRAARAARLRKQAPGAGRERGFHRQAEPVLGQQTFCLSKAGGSSIILSLGSGSLGSFHLFPDTKGRAAFLRLGAGKENRMKQRTFSTELAYFLGLALLACGAALMAAADFGVSMVVAPAYILHLKLSQFWPFFSYGMAEYCLQTVLLLLMILVLRRFRLYYLFSFVAAVLYGFLLDGAMLLTAAIPMGTLPIRLLAYLLGLGLSAVSISLLFHSYIAPEVYELFVKELVEKCRLPIGRVKTCYDCSSCLLSILLSFAFFGLWQFEGVKLGTVFCALVNGWLIGRCSSFFERRYQFRDSLPLQKYFQ